MSALPVILVCGPYGLILEGIGSIFVLCLPVGQEAGPEYRKRIVLPVFEELEQIHEVRGGTQDRVAVLALAEIERAKECIQARIECAERILGRQALLLRGRQRKDGWRRGELLSRREEIARDNADL